MQLLGWWNGHGYSATMQFFTGMVKLPYVIGWLVIMIEFFSPLFILAGFAFKLLALLIIVVILITVQNKYFFMNWFGDQPGEGMEFFLLLIGLSVALIVNGK